MATRNEKRRRIKGRQTTKSFVMFPHDLLNHENFRTLRPRATKLVIDIAAQYNGRNKCTLYALTWLSIDECDGKLDIASTTTAPHDWKRLPDPDGGAKKT